MGDQHKGNQCQSELVIIKYILIGNMAVFGVLACGVILDSVSGDLSLRQPQMAGRVGSKEVVGAITAERTATSEPNLQKTEKKEQGTAAVDSVEIPLLPASLTSKLEAIAGSVGLFNISELSKQASFFAEARYRLTKMLQIGGSLAFRYQATEESWDAAAQILFGPTLNFVNDQGIQNAFFVSPKVGPTIERTTINGTSVNSSTHLTLSLSAGKRFALGEHASYAPSVGVVKELGSTLNFVIQPISISLFF